MGPAPAPCLDHVCTSLYIPAGTDKPRTAERYTMYCENYRDTKHVGRAFDGNVGEWGGGGGVSVKSGPGGVGRRFPSF